jgi:hypothetical protein
MKCHYDRREGGAPCTSIWSGIDLPGTILKPISCLFQDSYFEGEDISIWREIIPKHLTFDSPFPLKTHYELPDAMPRSLETPTAVSQKTIRDFIDWIRRYVLSGL